MTDIKNNLFKKKFRLKILLEDILYKPINIIVYTDKTGPIEQEAIKGITTNLERRIGIYVIIKQKGVSIVR